MTAIRQLVKLPEGPLNRSHQPLPKLVQHKISHCQAWINRIAMEAIDPDDNLASMSHGG